jgi:hypothetical protein
MTTKSMNEKRAGGKAGAASKRRKKDDVLGKGHVFRDTLTGELHYVANETGIALPVASTEFKALVAKDVGMSRRDPKFGAVLALVEDAAAEQAKPARVEHCAAYDRASNRFLVNLGAGLVIEVTATKMRNVKNGTADVVFIDEPGFKPLTWKELEEFDGDPARALAAVRDNILDTPPPEALTLDETFALTLAYWIGIFFDREYARGKPLLLFVGPIGSGKTMCSRKIGCALFGPSFEVSVSASPDRGVKDLAAAVAHSTLSVRDDLNEAPQGLVGLLLCVATGAKFELSAFHETLARQSMPMRGSVIFTASNPRWAKREDLLSRVLAVRVKPDNGPRSTEESEEDRLARAHGARAAAWFLVLDALGHVLSSKERPATVTRFRTWEQGVRAALAHYGLHDDLVSALGKMRHERLELALSADPFLGLLLSVARAHPGRAWTAADLNDALAKAAGMRKRNAFEPHVAVPRGAQELGKLLEQIERDGASVVRVQRAGKAHGNVTRWLIEAIDATFDDTEDEREREIAALRTRLATLEAAGAGAPHGGAGGNGGSEATPIPLRKKRRERALANGGATPPAPPRTPARALNGKGSPRFPRSPRAPRGEARR